MSSPSPASVPQAPVVAIRDTEAFGAGAEGANGARRGRIVEMQRARLLAATGEVACEHGASNVTVAHIVERAGVSRRTFYEIFTDCEGCLSATFADALERSQARVLPAWRSDGSWRERLRLALVELLCLFDEEPVLARLLLVESLAARSSVLERRARVLERLVDAIHDSVLARKPQATRVVAEGTVGGALAILHSRVSQPSEDRLIELTGPLMSMLVLPYEGATAARRELARTVHAAARTAEALEAPLRSDPFKDAGMRLTYRTMRVLSAIATRPGSSNREVGDLADMSDQGQVSKLLTRLERLELIANARMGRNKGEPNAWMLTALGRQVTARLGDPVTEGARHEHTAGNRDEDVPPRAELSPI